MAEIAYGKRANMQEAIDNDVIKENTFVITKDTDDPEMFFYDAYGNVLPLSTRTRFDSLDEATGWVERYPSPGKIITVKGENDAYVPYIILEDNSIVLLSSVIDVRPPLQAKTQTPSVHNNIPVTPDSEYYGLSEVNVLKVPYEEVDDTLGGKKVIIGERN